MKLLIRRTIRVGQDDSDGDTDTAPPDTSSPAAPSGSQPWSFLPGDPFDDSGTNSDSPMPTNIPDPDKPTLPGMSNMGPGMGDLPTPPTQLTPDPDGPLPSDNDPPGDPGSGPAPGQPNAPNHAPQRQRAPGHKSAPRPTATHSPPHAPAPHHVTPGAPGPSHPSAPQVPPGTQNMSKPRVPTSGKGWLVAAGVAFTGAVAAVVYAIVGDGKKK